MTLLSNKRFLSRLLSGMLLLSLIAGCASTTEASDSQTSTAKSDADSQYLAEESDFAPLEEDTTGDTSEASSMSSEPKNTKRCATWQDFVSYRERSPSFLEDMPWPQPPQRFQDGCIQVDDAPGGFNIYITENSFDDGSVMPIEPETDLVLGFIPPGGIRRSKDRTRLAPGEPEWMHIGFSSSFDLESNEDFYEVVVDGDYAQYQRLYTYSSPVPIEERVEMLEAAEGEWEAQQ